MGKSESKTLPHFRSIDELVNFFDVCDLGDYLNNMPDAYFEVDVKRKTHLFTLDTELAGKLTKIAKSKQVSSGALINSWIKEKIQEKIEKQPVSI